MVLTKNAQVLKLVLLGFMKQAENEIATQPSTEKPKGGMTAVDASVPVGPKGIPPKPANEVGKCEVKNAGAKLNTRGKGSAGGVAAAAGIAAAGAAGGFLAHRFTKKDKSKETKEAAAILTKDGPLTTAKMAGYVQGYMAKAPKFEEIEKVANAAGVNADALYERVMKKYAAGMLLPLIGGALAGGVAAPAVWQGLRGLGRFAMDPMGSMSRPQNMARYGGFSPMQSNRMQNLIMGEAARNHQMSSMMQGLRGAYTPAPNPWGTGAQPTM